MHYCFQAFTQLVVRYWFWAMHPNKEVSTKLMSLIEETEVQHPFSLQVLERMKNLAFEKLPGKFEGNADVYARAQQFKQSHAPTQHPILVVSHSGMLQALLSTEWDEENQRYNCRDHIEQCSLHELKYE